MYFGCENAMRLINRYVLNSKIFITIGLLLAIVQKFQVPHTLKERIVDLFVSTHFKKALPGYKIQDMGEARIDPFISQINDFKDLDQIVKKILGHSSRG